MGETKKNTTATNRTAYGRFFNTRKQSGGITVAVDITSHLIPWAIAKRMQADAWDEGFNVSENKVMDTHNPYRENK